MNWMDSVGNVLKQYTSGGAAAAPAPDVHAHFDEVMQAAPPSAIAEGLAAAFRSDQTPAFGQLLSTLFTNSNGEQKAGMLNQLLSSVNPAMITQILSGAGLSGLAGVERALTPDQAQKVSSDDVQQLAAHAEKTNPTIIDSLSSFYSQHGALIKTLGSGVLTVAMAKMAESQRKA